MRSHLAFVDKEKYTTPSTHTRRGLHPRRVQHGFQLASCQRVQRCGVHAAWSLSCLGHGRPWARPTPTCRGFVCHAEASIDASSSPASNLVLPSETRGTTSWCSFICSPPTCQGTFASTVTKRKPAAQAPNTNAIARKWSGAASSRDKQATHTAEGGTLASCSNARTLIRRQVSVNVHRCSSTCMRFRAALNLVGCKRAREFPCPCTLRAFGLCLDPLP